MLSVLLVCLMFFHALGQNPDCDYLQTVQANEAYVITSPNYPGSYPPNKACRWVANCPSGYQLRLDCYLELPLTSGCTGDYVLISRTGDSQLQNADRYCGRQTFSVLSVGQKISQGLITASNTPGGRFICNLTAQVIPPVTPTCFCGIRKQNRIVGGTQASVNEFPMMGGVIELAISSILCGAAIIGPLYLVSAAHCFDNQRPSGLRISVGDRNITRGQIYEVARLLAHPKYNPSSNDYDIGIITVKVSMTFSDRVSPVCLPFNYQQVNVVGVQSTVTGWGTLFFGGPKVDILRFAMVQIISNQQCQQTETDITTRQLCAYTPGKDPCQFDSGGPLMVTNNRTGQLILMGTISSGANCASQRPGIYTRVVEFIQWIVNNAPADYCSPPPP